MVVGNPQRFVFFPNKSEHVVVRLHGGVTPAYIVWYTAFLFGSAQGSLQEVHVEEQAQDAGVQAEDAGTPVC